LSLPGLYAVVDAEVATAHGWAPVDLAAAMLAGGATLLQIRGKQLSSAALLDVSRQIVRMAAPFGALVVVNDRADVAVLAGAAGVHVGQDDLSPADARAIVGADALVGAVATARDRLDPEGYVRIGHELWRARVRGGAVEKGGAVRLLEVRGLTLVVERTQPGERA